jgi:hypothetical protein
MTMSSDQQSLDNHARYVPGFHFVTLGLIAINFFVTVYNVIRNPGLMEAATLLPAIGLLLLFFYMRQFATANQDRIIRLEEQTRLQRLLAPDLASRVDQLTESQLIAMRFASDAELPDLTRRVLQERLDGAAIKKLIKTWRPDNFRV